MKAVKHEMKAQHYGVFVGANFLLGLVAHADDELGGLSPVLKALDQQGNRDGQIQRDELPDRLLRFFDSTDLNADGVLTWQEVEEAKARRLAVFSHLSARRERSREDRHARLDRRLDAGAQAGNKIVKLDFQPTLFAT